MSMSKTLIMFNIYCLFCTTIQLLRLINFIVLQIISMDSCRLYLWGYECVIISMHSVKIVCTWQNTADVNLECMSYIQTPTIKTISYQLIEYNFMLYHLPTIFVTITTFNNIQNSNTGCIIMKWTVWKTIFN